jgi:hypothetical protein
MRIRDRLSIIISFLALVVSSYAIFQNFKPAKISVDFHSSKGFLFSPKCDSNSFETINIPMLFTNSSHNMGLVRSVKLINSDKDTINWSYFSTDAANIVKRLKSYCHPFSISGQNEKFYTIEFQHSDCTGFYDDDKSFRILIETSNKTIVKNIEISPVNNNWKHNGSELLIK